MLISKVLDAALGYLELGLPQDALVELDSLPGEVKRQRHVLELMLAAQMGNSAWNSASETARLLCMEARDEPMFFLRAAFCMHETGDTQAARDWLLRGPKSLMDMAVFHYNLACYLWTLGEEKNARRHLRRAFKMDASLRDEARVDRDLEGINLEV